MKTYTIEFTSGTEGKGAVLRAVRLEAVKVYREMLVAKEDREAIYRYRDTYNAGNEEIERLQRNNVDLLCDLTDQFAALAEVVECLVGEDSCKRWMRDMTATYGHGGV